MINKVKYLYYYLADLALTVLTLNFLVRKKIIRRYVGKRKLRKILDAGCGTGILSRPFSKKQYYGVDIDKDIIWYAQKKRPGYKFLTGDLTNLNIKQKFDLVLIVGVLHHLSDNDINKFFHNLFHLMNLNAKIIIIEAIPPLLKFNIIGQLLRWSDKGKFIRRIEQYQKLISPSFKIIEKKTATEVFFDYAVFLAGK